MALNAVRLPGDPRNRLPEILRGWFGPDAGLHGTRHEVVLEKGDDAWHLRNASRIEHGLQLWRRYPREQIPTLFGLPFSVAVWNAGFVVRPGHVFLLVTLPFSAAHSSSVISRQGMPRPEACWMKASREVPRSSAALPLEMAPRR